MHEHLIIDGNAVYEIDIDCMQKMEKQQRARGKAAGQSERGAVTKQARTKNNDCM